MNLRHPFDKSTSVTVHDMLGISAGSRQDHFVVSTIDIQDMVKLAGYGATAVHVLPLKKSENAQNMLNRVSGWINESGALDQRPLHGDRREEYSISFYRLTAGSPYPSLIGHFFLEEHLFPDRHPFHAGCFDDFMRMLDRDRMGGEMLKTLVEDFELPLKKNIPATWVQDLRAASHPDCFIPPAAFAKRPDTALALV